MADSSSINEVHLRGNAGRDGELKYSATGTAMLSFSVATTRMVSADRERGLYREEVTWTNVRAWGRTADSAYVSKGDTVEIWGRLNTYSWDGDDGQKHYRTEVVAERLNVIPREGDGGPSNHQPRQQAHQGDPRWEGGRALASQQPTASSGQEDADDLPFE